MDNSTQFDKNFFSEIEDIKYLFCNNKTFALYELLVIFFILLLIFAKNLFNFKNKNAR